jgi:hypothetical protein
VYIVAQEENAVCHSTELCHLPPMEAVICLQFILFTELIIDKPEWMAEQMLFCR